jgi:hypothetical protein
MVDQFLRVLSDGLLTKRCGGNPEIGNFWLAKIGVSESV